MYIEGWQDLESEFPQELLMLSDSPIRHSCRAAVAQQAPAPHAWVCICSSCNQGRRTRQITYLRHGILLVFTFLLFLLCLYSQGIILFLLKLCVKVNIYESHFRIAKGTQSDIYSRSVGLCWQWQPLIQCLSFLRYFDYPLSAVLLVYKSKD